MKQKINNEFFVIKHGEENKYFMAIWDDIIYWAKSLKQAYRFHTDKDAWEWAKKHYTPTYILEQYEMGEKWAIKKGVYKPYTNEFAFGNQPRATKFIVQLISAQELIERVKHPDSTFPKPRYFLFIEDGEIKEIESQQIAYKFNSRESAEEWAKHHSRNLYIVHRVILENHLWFLKNSYESPQNREVIKEMENER